MRSLGLILLLLFAFQSCEKSGNGRTKGLKKIHEIFVNGQISECELNKELVYLGVHNNKEGYNTIYDVNGDQIAGCYWGCFSQPDSRCNELKDCELIYCIPNNIWGHPAKDSYNLGFK